MKIEFQRCYFQQIHYKSTSSLRRLEQNILVINKIFILRKNTSAFVSRKKNNKIFKYNFSGKYIST